MKNTILGKVRFNDIDVTGTVHITVLAPLIAAAEVVFSVRAVAAELLDNSQRIAFQLCSHYVFSFLRVLFAYHYIFLYAETQLLSAANRIKGSHRQ